MNRGIEELRNEISVASIVRDGKFEVEAFAEVFAARLEDAEAVTNLNVVPLHCRGPRGKGLELLGYAEDPIDQSLIILAGKYFGSDETLTMTGAKAAVVRATDFVEFSANGWLIKNLEISSREWEYAEYFSKQLAGGRISMIRTILITDGIMSDRIRTIENGIVAGLRTSYEVWDQRRIIEAALPDLGSEDIHIDFTRWLPEGLPCLLSSGQDKKTETVLAVIPASVLAEIFEQYGSLLLESNVRTFLSARGLVNRGIQATLANEPERFLAYNNGLTTTANRVEFGRSDQGPTILSLHRWQIVNGGQTTASLAHFLRSDKAKNVDKVSIQMKLVTVTESDSPTIVQSVAKYANSQNRVSTADLFSTHEFHVRLEQISRRLKAPAQEGKQYQTGWYYERARGQWENDRAAQGTARAQAKFELQYPKAQRINKTDWARYEYCWAQHPDLVSKGAQFVFADFAKGIDAQWTKDDGRGADKFGDAYFRDTVCKAIMYNSLRTEVLKQYWYKSNPGYLANIVSYAIARFAFQVSAQFVSHEFDFERVWKRQAVSDATLDDLILSAQLAQKHLTDPSRPQSNVTQWAKQVGCWDAFKLVPFKLASSTVEDILNPGEARDRLVDNRKQRRFDTSVEAVSRVVSISEQEWERVHQARSQVPISPVELELVKKFGIRRGQVPTERQADKLLKLLDRMMDHGIISRETNR